MNRLEPRLHPSVEIPIYKDSIVGMRCGHCGRDFKKGISRIGKHKNNQTGEECSGRGSLPVPIIERKRIGSTIINK